MSSDPNSPTPFQSGGMPSAKTPPSHDGSSGSGLKEQGQQVASRAIDTLQAEADKRKDDVTNQVKAVSSAIGSAADQIERQDDLPAWLTSGVRNVATSVEQFAGTLDGKSSADLFAEVRKFATDRPMIFLAACAAAGFAASRVLNADNGQGGGQ